MAKMPTKAGTFTAEEWLVLLAEYGGRCSHCGGDEHVFGGEKSLRKLPKCIAFVLTFPRRFGIINL